MVSSQTCLPLCPTKQTGVVALIFTIGSFQSQRTVKTLFTNITAQRQGREDGSCDSRQDWLTMMVSERHCFTQIWRLLEQPSCPSCPSCPSWKIHNLAGFEAGTSLAIAAIFGFSAPPMPWVYGEDFPFALCRSWLFCTKDSPLHKRCKWVLAGSCRQVF